MKSLIEEAYDSDNFRELGHRLIDQLADYLQNSMQGNAESVFRSFDPDTLYEEWTQDLENHANSDFNDWCQKVITDSIHLHDPGYMGHQVSPPLPETALAELLAALLNNGVGVYEMGSPAVAMERVVIKHLANQLGFGAAADGILTSGGTLGNLTALLAARQIMGDSEDLWNSGSRERLGIMVSGEAHYSISRAVKIMGWGELGLVKVPVDDQFRMDAGSLAARLSEAQEKGIRVVGVVGNACSTATGSFDPLNEIADFCQEHNLWFHVDAAHGGGAVYSQKYRYLLEGIHRADSVVVDFHKMPMCPALVTGVVFKNGSHSYKAFAQKASYLWEQEDETWYNLGKRTFECTKDMKALKVYAILRKYGTALFEEIIDRQFDLGKTFAALLKERSSFEVLTEPRCNIVCFRYLPKEWNQANAVNQHIRKQLLKNGNKYIVQTTIEGKLFLRTTLMNVFTTAGHLEELLDEIEEIAEQILA